MCISPLTLLRSEPMWVVGDSGKMVLSYTVEVACHECWQCIATAVHQWVGRNIAESKSAKAAHYVTLTYGRDNDPESPTFGQEDHPRAKVLTYSDVQKWLKRLRKAGFPCRYFVTGEYGGEKGRCHWHVLLYWSDKVPGHKLSERMWDDFWQHGHQWWETMHPDHVRYACKYILKEPHGEDDQQRVLPRMSKKPALGTQFFLNRAERHVEQELPPRDLFYSWPEVTRINTKTGRQQVIKFMMTGAVKRDFLNHYIARWKAAHPLRNHLPENELLDEWQDQCAGQFVDMEWVPTHKHRSAVAVPLLWYENGMPNAYGGVWEDEPGDLEWWMKRDHIQEPRAINCYWHKPYPGQIETIKGQVVNRPWYWVRRNGVLDWHAGLHENAERLVRITWEEYNRLHGLPSVLPPEPEPKPQALLSRLDRQRLKASW